MIKAGVAAGWETAPRTGQLLVGIEAIGQERRRHPGTEEPRFYIDGKLGPRPKADVLDEKNQPIYHVTCKLVGIPEHMVISDAADKDVASLKAKAFSPVKSHLTLELPDGAAWTLEGSFIEKNYPIRADGERVVEITRK
jgi:uncharacterized protein YxjI